MSKPLTTHIGPWFLFIALGISVLAAYCAFATVVLGALTPGAVIAFAGRTCLNIAAIALAARAFGRVDRLQAATVAFLIMTTIGLLVSAGLTMSGLIVPGGRYALFLQLAPLLPSLLILFFDLGLGAGSLAVGLILSMAWIDIATPPTTAASRQATFVPALAPDPAKVYPRQSQLLAAQIDDLRPGVDGQVELFAVLGAGHPFEGVFAREVRAVRNLLETDFGARDRTISLVNNARAPLARPLLTVANLTTALAGVAEAMNADEDILLLFLTSHGGPERFSVSFGPLIIEDLTPGDIGSALASSGIRHSVIVVSACYSGSFVDDLKGADRLVLTAAARDRQSFGCNDENEWTDWGRAFFVDSFPKTGDFVAAARAAAELVTLREADAAYEPSDPQIQIGRNIETQLNRWMTDLEPLR